MLNYINNYTETYTNGEDKYILNPVGVHKQTVVTGVGEGEVTRHISNFAQAVNWRNYCVNNQGTLVPYGMLAQLGGKGGGTGGLLLVLTNVQATNFSASGVYDTYVPFEVYEKVDASYKYTTVPEKLGTGIMYVSCQIELVKVNGIRETKIRTDNFQVLKGPDDEVVFHSYEDAKWRLEAFVDSNEHPVGYLPVVYFKDEDGKVRALTLRV